MKKITIAMTGSYGTLGKKFEGLIKIIHLNQLFTILQINLSYKSGLSNNFDILFILQQ